MIKQLEQELENEKKVKQEAMRPYNKRIKNLKTAIRNLKQFDETAVEMNTKKAIIAKKTDELS